jgi:hypothetical protein
MNTFEKYLTWKFGLILIGISILIALIFGFISFQADVQLEAPFHLFWPILLGLLTIFVFLATYWINKGLSFAILILFCLVNIGFNLIMMILMK